MPKLNGALVNWAQLERTSETEKINKHQAIEIGPHGARGRFLPVVLSTLGRLSLESVRLLGLLSHLQVKDFLSARGPGWDPDLEAQWIAAVCGRFFQRVKSRFTASVAVSTALRLLPPQPHPMIRRGSPILSPPSSPLIPFPSLTTMPPSSSLPNPTLCLPPPVERFLAAPTPALFFFSTASQTPCVSF